MSEIPTIRHDKLMSPVTVLPGWRSWGRLPRIIQYRVAWPVLSLSVFREHPDDPERLQALTAIRQNSTTDKDVVSTLTAALPYEVQVLLIKQTEQHLIGDYPPAKIGEHGPNPQESAVIARYAPNLQGIPDNQSLLPLLCHDIFARKLGRADLLQMHSDDELGTVSLGRIALGLSYVRDDDDGVPLYEILMMYGVLCMLHPQYADVFDPDIHNRNLVIPEPERRYSSLGWTDDASSFVSDVREKNVSRLAPYVPEHQTVEYCARGQCLQMTSGLVQGHDLRGHLGQIALDELDYGDVIIGNPDAHFARQLARRKR